MRQVSRGLDQWEPERGSMRIDASAQKNLTLIGGSPLAVEVEVAPHADVSAANECRSTAIDWLEKQTGTPLPRRAAAHRPFSHTERNSACRAVRIREARGDYWAAQLEQATQRGQATVTEVVVAHPEGRSPLVRIAVTDRSVVSAGLAAQYPAELLADMARRAPLLLGGRTLSHTPIVVESAETMLGFHRMLVDPGRRMPFAVVSVPPDVGDLGPLERQWKSLALALTGLAIVWVLPPKMTYRLSDQVSKSLSVFLGAWRFYRPGFNHLADRARHPLLLKNRMEDERGVEEAIRQFLSMAVEERVQAGTEGRLAIGYDDLARLEAAGGRGPARLVTLLRDSLRSGARETSPAESEPTSAKHGGRMLTDGSQGQVEGRQTEVREPVPGNPKTHATVRRGGSQAIRNERSLDMPRSHAGRYEQARRRAELAERERDEAVRRAEHLEALVRSMGGNPDGPLPR